MSQARDDLIRERAHAIWEAEGRPDGRRDQHWQQAATELSQAQADAEERDEAVLASEDIVAPGGSDAIADPSPPEKMKALSSRTPRKVAESAPTAPKGRRRKGA